MRFAYRPYDDRAEPSPVNESGVIHKPELRVRVYGIGAGASDIPLWGLVDIGATECILPFEVADQVGAQWLKRSGRIVDYTGAGHRVDYGRVQLQIRLKKQLVRWPTVVAFDRDRRGSALWGRYGFLNHFNVTFNGPERHFTIRLRNFRQPEFDVARIPSPSGRSDLITPDDQNP